MFLLRISKSWLQTAFVAALPLVLCGCIAAAAMPLIGVGMAAVTAFQTYKTVQLASGGTIEISFPDKNGKTAPVQPLQPVHRAAVWPGDEGDVEFANRLQKSGKFAALVAPASVSRLLTEAKEPAVLKDMTEAEQDEALQVVCRKARVDLVFGAIPLGASEHTNAFSFSRANVSYSADLIGFSCTQRSVVWRDHIVMTIPIGGSVPSTGEMTQASGGAWADRVFEAMGDKPVKAAS